MPGWDSAATDTAGRGDQTNCGVTRAQVGGRSRVIHAFFVGLWFPGNELCNEATVGTP